MTNLFQQLGSAGFAPNLLPIIPPNAPLSPHATVTAEHCGKVPGIYSDGAWHGFGKWVQHTATETDLERWDTWTGASIGIKTGRVIAIDIDALDPALAEACESAAIGILGAAPCRVGQAPKRLLAYRIASPIGKMAVTFERPSGSEAQRVEILGAGQQFVAYGVHPKTGKPYAWLRGDLNALTLGGLTEVTADKLKAYLEEVARLAEGLGFRIAGRHASSPVTDRKMIGDPSLIGNVAAVTEALAALGNNTTDYGEWITRLHAIKAALGGKEEHYPVYERWCLAWPGNTSESARNKWASVTHSAVGASYIIDCARSEAGWNNAKYEFAPIADQNTLYKEIFDEDMPAPKTDTKTAPRFKVRRFSQIARSLDRQWVIDEILPANGMAMLWAPPNEGKSFVALSLAMAIARGISWHGRSTLKGSTLYVATEGTFENRIEAYRQYHELAGKEVPFALIEDGVDLYSPRSTDAAEIIAAAKQVSARSGEPMRLIVVDTLAGVFSNGKENTQEDMGAVLTNLARIRRETGAAVLVVHHPGKNEKNGPRGSSTLPARLDATLELKKDTITVRKQRDGKTGDKFQFDLEEVFLGTNAKGKTITSCVAVPRADFEPLDSDTDAAEALAVLKAAIRKHGIPVPELGAAKAILGTPGSKAVPLDLWRSDLRKKWSPERSEEATRQAISRITRKLLKNHAVLNDNIVWLRGVTEHT